MSLLPNFTLRSTVAAVFVPSDRFFMRFVPLAPDLPALEQAELALEALAPFPPAQLFWGCCVSPDRSQALVYAAHRRRFTAEETAAWETHDLAVPGLLTLIGSTPARPGLRVLVGETSLSGAAWKDKNTWPVAVHNREFGETPTEAMRLQFVAELAAKAGLSNTDAEFLTGSGRARRERDVLIFEWIGTAGAVVSSTKVAWADQDALDVRDRAFLGKRRGERRRSELIWRLLLAGGAAAILAGLLDLSAVAFNLIGRAQQMRVSAQAPLVQQLDSAQSLNSRINDLTQRRLRFFEMLAAINEPRPASVQFLRTSSNRRNLLEVEAQTASADDVGALEAALRQMPTLEKVEVKNIRASNGVTTFGLAVTFKSENNLGGAQ